MFFGQGFIPLALNKSRGTENEDKILLIAIPTFVNIEARSLCTL
jgi:hypothetical protein